MRIWDISPTCLCRQHLLGEHRELHAIWNILTQHKSGYKNHPEVKRWQGKLTALKLRHELLVQEMTRRGYRHQSPLPQPPNDSAIQDEFIDPTEVQRQLLREKGCLCQP